MRVHCEVVNSARPLRKRRFLHAAARERGLLEFGADERGLLNAGLRERSQSGERWNRNSLIDSIAECDYQTGRSQEAASQIEAIRQDCAFAGHQVARNACVGAVELS